MSNNRKLTIKMTDSPAVIITRNATRSEKLVYLAVVNKSLVYPHGKSRIAYIGTTKAGPSRIASSAASKAEELFDSHGVSSLRFFVITCRSRQRIKTWRKLEAGLLLVFREQFGTPPKCNKHGKRMKWSDERDYFTRARLEVVIQKYST